MSGAADPITFVPWSSGRDGLAFVEHLATLTRGGLPLPSGLRALAAEPCSDELRRTLLDTADMIDAGVPLDDAVRLRADRFPPYLRGLIAAGVRAGILPDLLAQFVKHRTDAKDTRRRFWISLAYPLLLIAAVAILAAFLLFGIVPMFRAVTTDFGINLPFLTVALFTLADFLSEYGPPAAIGLGIGGVLLLVGARILLTAADRRRVLTALPVLGSVLRYSALGEFCHTLGSLVEAETPLPEAMDLAAQTTSDASLIEDARRMREAIEKGASLEEALRYWRDCPAGLGDILAWAESHRNLSGSLHLAGEMYEERARSQAGFAAVLCGTLCLIFVVWLLALTIIALYLPFFQLLARLSG